MTCSLCALAKKALEQGDVANVYSYVPHETYSSPWPTLYFNCTMGYQIAKRKKRRLEMMPRLEPEIQDFVRAHNIVEEHIDHVPLNEPALGGHIVLPEKATGEPALITILLDGHHRALRHFKEGLDCPIFMLTPEEMFSIMGDNPMFKWLDITEEGDLTLYKMIGSLIDR